MNLITDIFNTLNNDTLLALVDEQQSLTYAQFKQRVQQLAGVLQQQPNTQRVAIALDRGIDAAIAIFAVLYSGMTYVPLDIKNPLSRLQFIVNDADVQQVIGQGDKPKWISSLWIDSHQTDKSFNANFIHVDSEQLAAILYTSGSTGTPKGVALSHRAMANFSQWAAKTFKLNSDDNIASLAPFHFDLSVFDLFSSLSTGATLYFVPAPLTLSPSRLTTWLSEQAISVFYTVPSLLSFVALKGNLKETPLNHLRYLLFAGEVFPTTRLIKLADYLPKVKLFNLYGPTETNVCCYWQVDRNRLNSQENIPIGISAANSTLKIHPETQELFVKSANNLSGYWQKGQLIDNVMDDSWYATGDKVSINRHNEYCYQGRLDRMLKCSGYRVEPAEIEAIINRLSSVEIAAVIGREDSTYGQRPVIFVVLTKNNQLKQLMPLIKNYLPVYMQPSKVIVKNKLPLLSNGKIDYQALGKEVNGR